MKQYDTTFIIDGSLDQTQRENLIEKFEKSLEKLGGEIDRTIRWGLRALAYAIKKRSRGYYVIFYYSAEPSVIKSFEAELKLNEHILRYMTLLFDGKHPDYIRDESISRTESSNQNKNAKIPEPISEISADISNDEVTEIVEENPEIIESDEVSEVDISTSVSNSNNEIDEIKESHDAENKEDE